MHVMPAYYVSPSLQHFLPGVARQLLLVCMVHCPAPQALSQEPPATTRSMIQPMQAVHTLHDSDYTPEPLNKFAKHWESAHDTDTNLFKNVQRSNGAKYAHTTTCTRLRRHTVQLNTHTHTHTHTHTLTLHRHQNQPQRNLAKRRLAGQAHTEDCTPRQPPPRQPQAHHRRGAGAPTVAASCRKGWGRAARGTARRARSPARQQAQGKRLLLGQAQPGEAARPRAHARARARAAPARAGGRAPAAHHV